MSEVVKVNDTTVDVTAEKTTRVTLDQLKAISTNLGKSITSMTAQKADYDDQITQAIALGVKTAKEA